MAAPSISVVIPAYNAAAWVARAIESALAQTVPPVDVIVVDDCSTDQTCRVVERYEPAVRLIRRATTGGPGAARNSGIMVGGAEWIALLDADDAWLPHKLERQAPCLVDPAVAVVHSRMTSGAEIPVPLNASFAALWQANCVVASSALIRRSAVAAAGGFDESRSLIGVEDYNLWLRLAAAGWMIRACPEPLVEYHPVPGNLTSRMEERLQAELANVVAIAAVFKLDRGVVLAKERRVLRLAGDSFFYVRDLVSARRCYRAVLREQISAWALFGWSLTFLPSPMLDIRRHFRSAFG